jgi:hypothetical protein
MGYSARYHAASLAAVFIALAVGILIGAEFGGDLVSNTRKSLEQSLTGNLQDARERADELSGRLGESREFEARVYPALVDERLAGRRIGLLALGGLPDSTYAAIEDTLRPTGARLVAVGVVREPPDLQALAEALSETRFADLARNPDSVQALGTGVGRQLVFGGSLFDLLAGRLFSRASGAFGGLDGLIVVRSQPQRMTAAEQAATARLEGGLLDGVTATRTVAVGVEETGTESSSIPFFDSHDIASADSVDLVAGRVAVVFSLLGAEGSFGTKGSADRFLPEILAPVPQPPPRVEGQGRAKGAGG